MDKIIGTNKVSTACWASFNLDEHFMSPEEFRELHPAEEQYDIHIDYNGKRYKFNLEDADIEEIEYGI